MINMLLCALMSIFPVAGSTGDAMNYIVHEWIGKPVVVVSYGVPGVKMANEQVKQTLGGIRCKVCRTLPRLAFACGRGPDMFTSMSGGRVLRSRPRS
ncbi:hypothetical protein F5Y15DRAFT_384614 [Xylariaceae sp. FL0016]|nr:hypothetical protein F5Y15DRAFT_384614 [Xylariaceae sp. FL0016]